MGVQGALWLAKCLSSALILVFLTGFRYFSYQVATQLSSRGWVDPVPDPILSEKCLGYSLESNPGPLGWQSDVLTTIPNRRSVLTINNNKWTSMWVLLSVYYNIAHRHLWVNNRQNHPDTNVLLFFLAHNHIKNRNNYSN